MKFTTTLEDYRAFVKRKLSLSSVEENNLEWSNEFINDAVQEARTYFWGKRPYTKRFGFVTMDSVVDQATYTIPETVDQIEYIRYTFDGTTKQIVHKTSREEILLLSSSPTDASGISYEYAKIGNTVQLWPASSQAIVNGIEFWGKKGMTELTTDLQVDGDIESRWKPLICTYVLGLCWEKAEQMQMAGKFFERFEATYADFASEIINESSGEDISTILSSEWIDETDDRHWGHLS